MRTIVLLVVTLALALPALAQTEFNPGGVIQAPASVVTVISTPVTTTSQSAGTMRLSVEKVFNVPPLTAEQESAVREYLNKYAPNLTAENLAATANGLRLLIGIEQTHIPLTRRPGEIMADYQIVTQMLKYLRMYVNVPMIEFFLQPLPGLGQVARAERVSLPVYNCEFVKVSRELRFPEPQVCWYPNNQGLLVPSGPTGAQNSVSIVGITPDLTPLAWMWLWKQWQEKSQPCPKPNDGTCGPPPPGGVPSPPPGDAAQPGTPGSGSQGPGLGDGNGYTPLLPPPPGYGSGDAAPPGAGPLPPGPGQPPPAVPPPGQSPVTPAG